MRKKFIIAVFAILGMAITATLYTNPAIAGGDLDSVVIELKGIQKDGHLQSVNRKILKRLEIAIGKLQKIARGEKLPKPPENRTPYRNTSGALFSEDFSKFKQGIWKSIGGEINVDSRAGEVTLRPNKNHHPMALAGDYRWDDYTLYGRVKLIDGNYAGFIFRAFTDENYYEVVLNAKYNRVELWSFIENNRESMVEGKHDVYKNTWYNLKIDAKGNYVTIYINGIERIKTRVGKLAGGRIGISSYSKETRFDDIIVKPL